MPKPPKWNGCGFGSNNTGAGPPSGKAAKGKASQKNNHVPSNRLRVTQQYVEVVGLGATNNRLRVTNQYVEVVGLGATNNRLRVTKQYVEVIITLARPRSFASII